MREDNFLGGLGNVARMRRMRKRLLGLLLFPFVCCAPSGAQTWIVENSAISSNLRGLSVARTVIPAQGFVLWASGSNGMVLRSIDLGFTETRDNYVVELSHVTGGETLDFRGVRAFNEKTAYLISSGQGNKSRIYKTTDGGTNWEMQYTDERPAFFLDDIVCFTEKRCFVLGDPIDGKFLILSTEDGKSWKELPGDNMPAIIPGEGAFAASGTSLAIYGKSDIYFGTGGGATARVFHSPDLGRTWTVSDTPLAAGNASSGVFSIVRVKKTLIAVGGDYKAINETLRVAALSKDGGATWKLASAQPGGYRSAVAILQGKILVSVGPNGGDVSRDLGVTWKHTDAINLNSVAVSNEKKVWAVGARGVIASLTDPSFPFVNSGAIKNFLP